MRAQTRIIQDLLYRGLKPSTLRIDNTCPEALKKFFRSNNIDFQLCPPKNHHSNQAEKEIDTWKCYFLSGLSGVYPNVSLHLWCLLLPQATQTLNILRRSQINPRLSAESQLNKAFDYNRNHMTSPMTKFLIHKTPQQRRTYDFHDREGWYIGTAPLHYRCYHIYTPETRGQRIAKTVHNPPPPPHTQWHHARYVLLRFVQRRS